MKTVEFSPYSLMSDGVGPLKESYGITRLVYADSEDLFELDYGQAMSRQSLGKFPTASHAIAFASEHHELQMLPKTEIVKQSACLRSIVVDVRVRDMGPVDERDCVVCMLPEALCECPALDTIGMGAVLGGEAGGA
jgi:hypothetical protein